MTLATAVETVPLRPTDEVDRYLAEAEAHSAAVRRENAARYDMAGLRERLLGPT